MGTQNIGLRFRASGSGFRGEKAGTQNIGLSCRASALGSVFRGFGVRSLGCRGDDGVPCQAFWGVP